MRNGETVYALAPQSPSLCGQGGSGSERPSTRVRIGSAGTRVYSPEMAMAHSGNQRAIRGALELLTRAQAVSRTRTTPARWPIPTPTPTPTPRPVESDPVTHAPAADHVATATPTRRHRPPPPSPSRPAREAVHLDSVIDHPPPAQPPVQQVQEPVHPLGPNQELGSSMPEPPPPPAARPPPAREEEPLVEPRVEPLVEPLVTPRVEPDPVPPLAAAVPPSVEPTVPPEETVLREPAAAPSSPAAPFNASVSKVPSSRFGRLLHYGGPFRTLSGLLPLLTHCCCGGLSDCELTHVVHISSMRVGPAPARVKQVSPPVSAGAWLRKPSSVAPTRPQLQQRLQATDRRPDGDRSS